MVLGTVVLLAALLANCGLPALARNATHEMLSVSKCADLVDALETESQKTIIISVSKNIKCYSSEWNGFVVITSRVVMAPMKQGLGGSAPFVDFGNAQDVLHIAGDASLRIENLVLRHETVDVVGSLSATPFVTGDPGARFTTAGVLLSYTRCPKQPEAPPATTTTHAIIEKARGFAGPSHAGGDAFSPESFIQESFTREDGVDYAGCQTLVTCGILNRTTTEFARKTVATDAARLCLFDGRQKQPAMSSPDSTTGHPATVAAADPTARQSSVVDDNEVAVTAGEPVVDGGQPKPRSKKSGPNVAVVVGVVVIGVTVLIAACVGITLRNRRCKARAQMVNSAIIDMDVESRVAPAPDFEPVLQAPNPGPIDSVPQKIIAKRKPPTSGAATNLDSIINSFDAPQVNGIRVIRELPMSEMAQSECNDINTFGGSDAPVIFQLSGLEVSMRRLLGNGTSSSVYEGTYKSTPCAMKMIEHGRDMLEMHSEPMEDYLTKDLVQPNTVKLLATRTCLSGAVNRWLSSLQAPGTSSSGASSSSDPLSTALFNAALLPRFQDEGSDDVLYTIVVMEYCNGGTLAQALQAGRFFANGKQPNLPLILMRAIDIAHAMEHLHQHCVIHGDLKPENVLLHMTHNEPSGFVCKVVDFSMRAKMPAELLVDTMSHTTMAHMPPELLQNGDLSPASDVYSFGMILWGMLSGSVPFPSLKRGELVRHVVAGDRPPVPSGVPPTLGELVEECWCTEPGRRPDFSTILYKLRETVSQVTGPSRNVRKSYHQQKGSIGRDAAAKSFDSSDCDSPIAGRDASRCPNSFGQNRAPRPRASPYAQQGAERNVDSSKERGVSGARRAVRFANTEEDDGGRGTSQRGASISGPPTSSWEYDGDFEMSTGKGSTIDSLQEQSAGPPPKRYLKQTTSGKSSTGWSVASSVDDDAYADPGYDRSLQNVAVETVLEDQEEGLPVSMSRATWTDSTAATDDDYGRLPDTNSQWGASSEDVAVQRKTSSSHPQR